MKQQVKISKVKGNPKNPRIIKNDKFNKLKNSIKTLPNYMKLRPVIVDEDMMVLGGNMRLKASIDLGKKEIWTDMFTQADCDEMNEIAIEEKRETKTYLEYCDEIIIKDNVSAGDWEWDMLANEWDSVQLNDFGLDVWENEDDKVTEGLIDDDEIPEVKESKVKRGDVWQLGEHRVMCGDSTSSDDVKKLMNGEKADLITDPPYGINANKQTLGTGKKQFYRGNDWDKEVPDFWNMIPLFDKCIIWGGNYFTDKLSISNDWLCWHKKNDNLSFSEFELAWSNVGKNCRILSHHWGGEKKLHPTMKPVKVMEWCIGMINSNNIIFDLFLGSGSTLIAAEKLKRKCYGMELDEKYCDVIIERWEQFTGLKATIINGTK